ncbi:hypothetical protein RSP795_24110 [Ralstonia solanacearum]|nr:hypothetical protein RSP795_24110 [Ralstonia solanacearum]
MWCDGGGGQGCEQERQETGLGAHVFIPVVARCRDGRVGAALRFLQRSARCRARQGRSARSPAWPGAPHRVSPRANKKLLAASRATLLLCAPS